MDFTVAICTYNGAKRLPSVLDRLRVCHGHMSDRGAALRWEIVVVDNNSSDGTAQVVADYQSRWPSDCPLRCVSELQQGLAFARQRAIESAAAPIVGFLDDDNLPDPNWILAAHGFLATSPKAGVAGSRVLPEYEVPPPPDFDRIRAFLALTDRGDLPHLYQPAARVLPPGAGLVVRRDLWLRLVPERLELVGRTDGQMRASEDLEAVLHFQNMGWEVWYVPDAIVRHQIPRWRLTEEYLSQLMYGVGLSRYRTRTMRYPSWMQLPILLLYTASDLLRLVRHRWEYGRAWRSKTVAVAQRQLYLGSLVGMQQAAAKSLISSWERVFGQRQPR
ncbi:MAG: hormogonium polysaccharide biosynthesis glycosyltransferase HpsE [Geitlerinemataceae cyanobacterium]